MALTPVASGLAHPWAVAFLPGGRFLVTERPGRMRLYRDGTLSEPLRGLPEVDDGGQGVQPLAGFLCVQLSGGLRLRIFRHLASPLVL